jgi:hypothetical protein
MSDHDEATILQGEILAALRDINTKVDHLVESQEKLTTHQGELWNEIVFTRTLANRALNELGGRVLDLEQFRREVDGRHGRAHPVTWLAAVALAGLVIIGTALLWRFW